MDAVEEEEVEVEKIKVEKVTKKPRKPLVWKPTRIITQKPNV